MAPDEESDGHRYTAVINAEEQYSVWRTDLPIPDGWDAVGAEGTKAECLAYVEREWTDMRPRSLREAMRESVSE